MRLRSSTSHGISLLWPNRPTWPRIGHMSSGASKSEKQSNESHVTLARPGGGPPSRAHKRSWPLNGTTPAPNFCGSSPSHVSKESHVPVVWMVERSPEGTVNNSSAFCPHCGEHPAHAPALRASAGIGASRATPRSMLAVSVSSKFVTSSRDLVQPFAWRAKSFCAAGCGVQLSCRFASAYHGCGLEFCSGPRWSHVGDDPTCCWPHASVPSSRGFSKNSTISL
mmetsp:Transcript_6010/g.17373  ORF Transcript_6010/g.17373 Transcript_6010/m.17373 type:complete len:224 (+) Transcript_6010:100-771(+)